MISLDLSKYVKTVLTCTIWLDCQAVTPDAHKLLSLIILNSGSDGHIVGGDLRGVAAGSQDIKRIIQLAQYETVLSLFSFNLNRNHVKYGKQHGSLNY